MINQRKNRLRYLLTVLMALMAFGLTQCQSPSDHIAVAPATKDEHVKPDG
jgi:uncharacterized lipoprotein YajG